MRKPTMWFLNRSHTNWSVPSPMMARSLKFWIKKVEELYYLCGENKGADQLRGYREADLRLCFRICRLLVFPQDGSYIFTMCFWSPTLCFCARCHRLTASFCNSCFLKSPCVTTVLKSSKDRDACRFWD